MINYYNRRINALKAKSKAHARVGELNKYQQCEREIRNYESAIRRIQSK